MDVVHTLEEIYQARTKNTSTSSLNIARKDRSKVDSFDDCQPSLSKHPPLELVPVPGHGSQISARAPTKRYVQTGTHARTPGKGTSLNRAFRVLLNNDPLYGYLRTSISSCFFLTNRRSCYEIVTCISKIILFNNSCIWGKRGWNRD